jgi:serine/threonine protein kinase
MELGAIVGIVGLSLSIPGIADKCVCLAYDLHEKIRQFRQVKVLLKESLEEHEIYTKQVAISILFVKDISPSLSPELNDVIGKALYQLSKAFEATLDLVQRAVDDAGNVRRWWFVLHGKSALEKSLGDVNKRHDIFLRCLHYSVLFGGSAVGQHITDERLCESATLAKVQHLREAVVDRLKDTPLTKVLLGEDDVPSGLRVRLHPHSAVRIVHPEGEEESAPSLIEYRQYDPADNRSLRRVRDIALILRSADIAMGILQCRGFYPQPVSMRCELVFHLPQGMENPRTLRDLLTSPDNAQGARHSLTSRIQLAIRLATAVLYVHAAKFVHKNIRPENILLLESQDDDPSLKFPHTLGTSFLIGFDVVRKEDEASSRTGDEDWEKNIYRHPERQGLHPESGFNMLHDIYSLGVVLLEIALWRSFVTSIVEKDGVKYVPNPQACKFVDRTTGSLKPPREIQRVFVKKAEEYIPLVLGERYRDIVLMCLKSVDGAFGSDEVLDEDGIVVGLIFIQRVLTSLEEISI